MLAFSKRLLHHNVYTVHPGLDIVGNKVIKIISCSIHCKYLYNITYYGWILYFIIIIKFNDFSKVQDIMFRYNMTHIGLHYSNDSFCVNMKEIILNLLTNLYIRPQHLQNSFPANTHN